MRAGDFVGVKVYRKPAEDKRTKKDGTPRSPKKLGIGGIIILPSCDFRIQILY